MRFSFLSLVSFCCVTTAQGIRFTQTCECGRVGSECNETGFYDALNGNQVVRAEVTTFVNGSCNRENTVSCYVQDGTAKCSCYKGFIGETCDEEREAIMWNLLGPGIGLPLVISGFATVKILKVRQDKCLPPKGLVEGKASVKALFFFRLLVVTFCAGVLISQYATLCGTLDEARSFLMYNTIWNFHLLIAVFGVGTWLSYKRWNADGKSYEDRELTKTEYFFYVAFQVEFAFALGIMLVTWGFLFPTAATPQDKATFLNYGSYVQHGGNALFMGIDYFLNGIVFKREHIAYTVWWASMYVVVHNLVMLIDSLSETPHAPQYGLLDSSSPITGAMILFVIGYSAMWFRLIPTCCKKNSVAVAPS